MTVDADESTPIPATRCALCVLLESVLYEIKYDGMNKEQRVTSSSIHKSLFEKGLL